MEHIPSALAVGRLLFHCVEGLRIAAIPSPGLQEKADLSFGCANRGGGNGIFVWE